jgi:DNA-directed RNA polymerase specialized sigma24 family protein
MEKHAAPKDTSIENIVANQAAEHDDEARGEEFVRLLTSHQLDIYLYVHSLAPDPTDAQEILQDTNVVLWKKRSQFDMTRDFRPWAFQIARYELLKYRSKHKHKFLCFSDAFVDELGIEATQCATPDNEFSMRCGVVLRSSRPAIAKSSANATRRWRPARALPSRWAVPSAGFTRP